jgi:hypothetical protein
VLLAMAIAALVFVIVRPTTAPTVQTAGPVSVTAPAPTTTTTTTAPRAVIVPNLTGDTVAEAEATLRALGLTAVTQANTGCTPSQYGDVIGQSLLSGYSVGLPATDTLAVCTAPAPTTTTTTVPLVQVPNLTGDTVAQAAAALSACGLRLGEVYGPTTGTVFSQVILPGYSERQGSSVNIYTSTPGG